MIISKESDLAKYGSLSYRFNVGPMIEEEDVADKSNADDVDEYGEDGHSEIDKDLKKELKERKDTMKALEAEYKKCVEELKRKTVEAEKLRTELKDLREIAKLDDELKDADNSVADEKENLNEEEFLVQMKRKGSRRTNPHNESSPIKPKKTDQLYIKPTGISKKAEPEYNCNSCDYQGTEKDELSRHVNLKHKTGSSSDNDEIKCRNCGKSFRNKSELMYHRKREHLSSVASCRNHANGNCTYSSDLCWWKHSDDNEQSIKCYVCGETFDCKSNMMKHRKIAHSSIIVPCNKFNEKKCRFNDNSCWFKHQDDEKDLNKSSVFQNAPKKKEPPINHL